MTLQNQRVDGTGTQQRVLRVPQLGRDVVLLIFIFIYLLFIWLMLSPSNFPPLPIWAGKERKLNLALPLRLLVWGRGEEGGGRFPGAARWAWKREEGGAAAGETGPLRG